MRRNPGIKDALVKLFLCDAAVSVNVMCVRVQLSEYSMRIRSTIAFTEGSLWAHTAPEPARPLKPCHIFVWLAFLLFILLPFRFLSL